jgi:hypothetical protein
MQRSHRHAIAATALITLSALTVTVTLTFDVPAAHADRMEDRARSAYQEGTAAMGQKDYGTAVNRFESAVRLHPLAAYRVALCEASTRWEDWSQAESYCTEALAAATGADKRKVETLIARRTQALAADHVKDARSRAEVSEWDDAATEYRAAIQLDPRPEYYLALCDVLEQGDHGRDAAQACDEAAKRSSGAAKTKAAARADGLRQAVTSAPTAEQERLLDKLSTAVVIAHGMDLRRRDARDVHTYLSNSQDCVDAVAAAEKGGVKPFHLVRVDKEFPGAREKRRPRQGPAYYAPFDKAKPFCRATWTAVRAMGATAALEASLARLESIAAGKVDLDDGAIAYAGIPVAPCKKGVAAALAAGILPGEKLTVGKVTVTLGQADATICSKLETEVERLRAELAAKLEAEKQAKLAPFKKVLKGDKMRTYEQYGMYDLRIYGVKGYELSTPDDFRTAAVWFMVLNGEDDRGRTTWILRRLKFSGNKLRGETEKTGLGSEPPSKLYR